MARINSYPLDATIQDKDAWIGSDSVTRATKQYTAAAVAKYLNTAPASATATGTLGSIKFTADHIYVCVATNTWKRVAIATF